MARTYVTIPASAIPTNVRWDVPARNQGQIVEVAYAEAVKSPYEAGYGSTYRRTTDRSDGSVTYAALEVEVVTGRPRRAFSDGSSTRRFLVRHNEVLAWDSVAGHYTTCHSLTPRQQVRIRCEVV